MKKEAFCRRVVLITGAGQGIGKALAEALGSRGACLVINDISAERLEMTGNELRSNDYPVLCVAGDVSNPADCETMISTAVDTFGRIDILINNAGLSAKGSVEMTDPSVFKALVEVNILGAVYTTKYALPFIRESRGSILFISSLAAISGIPYGSAYSASKMALTALSESLRIELHGSGIHIGIAYLSFTANDPEKRMYDSGANWVAVPERKGFKVTPAAVTAARIVRQIEKRKYRVVHSSLGKLNWFLGKAAPGLVEKIKVKSLEKFRY